MFLPKRSTLVCGEDQGTNSLNTTNAPNIDEDECGINNNDEDSNVNCRESTSLISINIMGQTGSLA